MKNIVLSLLTTFLLLAGAHSADLEIENGHIHLNGFKKKRDRIDFSDQSCLSEEMRKRLATSHPIESCTLDETPLGESDLKLISTLSNLRTLSVIGCGLRKNNLVYFNIPSLEELFISHNQFNLSDLKDLTLTNKVTVFHCWGIPVGDEGIKYLVRLMPKLKEVNLAACSLQDDSLVSLLLFNQLEKVILSHNTFSKKALASFQFQAHERNIKVIF